VEQEERRKNLRVKFNTSVWIYPIDDVSGAAIFCQRTRDLSLRGIYCYTDHRLSEGSLVDIRLQLLGTSSALSLNIKAHVVRVDYEGIALQFDLIDLDGLFYLKNILYYNSGDPEKIDHELVG